MARPSTEHYDLSETEKRDLIKLIEQGKPLPEKYRFMLFADKREVELVWNGKTREVCTAILPFQTLEHIDEPRKETAPDQASLFDTSGRQTKGWTNKLIWGDNKLILSSLKSGALRRQIEDAGGLKLIYIDPPFDVGADFSMDIEIGGETFHKEPNLLEQIAYRDTWGRGADSFISMIYERLILMRDLLHPEGSIYVHCDWRLNSLIRIAMDEVFGRDLHRNEVVWCYKSGGAGSTVFARKHDTILCYGKTDSAVFNVQKEKSYMGLGYSTGNVNVTLYDDQDGLGPYTLVNVKDWWSDIGMIATSKGRLYPTQKPEELLERIILVSSNEGDLIADFFCGSGTTAAVAEKLGRKWITSDLGKFGIHTTRKRLIQVQRDLKTAGKPFRAFEVLNLGRYERQAYLNVGGRLSGKKKEQALARKEQEFRELILKAYRAEPLGGGSFVGSAPASGAVSGALAGNSARTTTDADPPNESSLTPAQSSAGARTTAREARALPDSFFHGKTGGRLVVVGPINLPVGRLFVEEVIMECRKRGATRVDVLAFEFEMGLGGSGVFEDGRQKGIDVALKTIPPEVFDKRAVEKGQVRFADIAYVEATPRYDKKDKLALSIELTDFSVHYSQGLVDSITAELKAGKSEVVCDAGQLAKFTKDKDGIVKREVLTKKWTDWVDYWAVDFNYESRKEIIKMAKTMGVDGELPGVVDAASGEFLEFEERWTGAYIFENEWQSFRTRRDRDLEMTTVTHTYAKPGRYTVAIKVIDIFGNDTMTLVPVNVG
jgi:site-specific DNA-methyltransferase (adenine-specific)/adenine-specific DNA-methyltransferase